MILLNPDQFAEFAILPQAMGERAVIVVTPERIEGYVGREPADRAAGQGEV